MVGFILLRTTLVTGRLTVTGCLIEIGILVLVTGANVDVLVLLVGANVLVFVLVTGENTLLFTLDEMLTGLFLKF